MALQRGKHHWRRGNGIADARPIHANGRTKPLALAEGAHADFLGDGEETTGFDAEGIYKIAGVRQSVGLAEPFGNNAQILNDHKWLQDGAHTFTVKDDHFEIAVAGAGLHDLTGRRWSLAADFNLEIQCEIAGMPAGTGAGAGQDSAVWLQVHQLDDPAAYWRVKRTRTNAANGFAGEVAGVGAQLGFQASVTNGFRLVAIRIGGTLHLRAIVGVDNYLIWHGAVSGHLVLSVGVQGVGGAWTARLFELFQLGTTVHDYSGTASWLGENDRPAWLEDWSGYDLHPLRWSTPSTSGGATLAPTTLSSTQDPGYVEIRMTGAAAQVTTESIALDGDFIFSLPFRHRAESGNVMDPLAVDAPFRLELHSATDGYPRLFVDVAYIQDGGGAENTEYRLFRKDTAMGAAVSLANFSTIAPSDVWRAGVFTVAKRGSSLQITFEDDDGIHWDHLITTFPTVALTLVLGGFTTSTGADVTALVGALAVRQPYAVSGPLVGDYVAATFATMPSETVAEGADEPATAGLVILDTRTRAILWQIIGTNLAGVDYETGIPGGRINGAWIDPAGGRIVLAVEQDGEAAQWFTIDFGRDLILRLASDGEREFQGSIAQRHLGLGFGDAVSAPADLPATGTALAYFEVEGCAIWVASSGILVRNITTTASATLCPDGGIVRARLVAAGSGDPAALVVADDTGLVAVYTGFQALAAGANESANGDEAATTYTVVAGTETFDVDAMQTASGLHLLVARGDAAVVLAPGEPHLVIPTAADPVAVDELLAPVRACAFAFAPRIDTSPRNGWALFGTDDDDIGELTIFSLQTLLAIERIDPRDLVGDDYPDPSTASRAISTASLVALRPPGGFGSRAIFGCESASVGLIEVDILSLEVGGTGWRGPHVGGAAFGAEGFNLDLVRDVRIGSTAGAGGIACFRLEARPASGFRGPYFVAVPRALGFILNAPEANPVIANATLIATPTWPQEVSLDLADGSVLALPAAYTYESKLCIEYTAARLLSKLPGAMLDPNPKRADSPQRHFMVGVATALCWLFSQQAITRRDSSVETAEGIGLGLLAASYGTRAPVGLDDDALRAWIPLFLGGGITTKAILDLLEIVLGYRPTMTEGYRWFRIELEGVLDDSNFWGGDANGVDGFNFWFWDHDFFDGDGGGAPVLALLEHVKAAGVRAEVVTPLE